WANPIQGRRSYYQHRTKKKKKSQKEKKAKTGQPVPSGQNQNKRLKLPTKATAWQDAAAACSTDNQLGVCTREARPSSGSENANERERKGQTERSKSSLFIGWRRQTPYLGSTQKII
ncbi:hypothetical protein ILYODFUR_033941, partial [Ilyodon furcidens]